MIHRAWEAIYCLKKSWKIENWKLTFHFLTTLDIFFFQNSLIFKHKQLLVRHLLFIVWWTHSHKIQRFDQTSTMISHWVLSLLWFYQKHLARHQSSQIAGAEEAFEETKKTTGNLSRSGCGWYWPYAVGRVAMQRGEEREKNNFFTDSSNKEAQILIVSRE